MDPDYDPEEDAPPPPRTPKAKKKKKPRKSKPRPADEGDADDGPVLKRNGKPLSPADMKWHDSSDFMQGRQRLIKKLEEAERRKWNQECREAAKARKVQEEEEEKNAEVIAFQQMRKNAEAARRAARSSRAVKQLTKPRTTQKTYARKITSTAAIVRSDMMRLFETAGV